jgi:hypothetical protein
MTKAVAQTQLRILAEKDILRVFNNFPQARKTRAIPEVTPDGKFFSPFPAHLSIRVRTTIFQGLLNLM